MDVIMNKIGYHYKTLFIKYVCKWILMSDLNSIASIDELKRILRLLVVSSRAFILIMSRAKSLYEWNFHSLVACETSTRMKAGE